MSFVYTGEKTRRLNAGGFDMLDDMRVMLLLNTTTADTDQDASTVSDIGTLGECADASYARKALTSEAVNQDNVNNRAEFDADNPTWTAFTSAGTLQGVMLYRHIDGTAPNDQVVAFLDTGGINGLVMVGGNLEVQWNAEGIVQAT